jgi:hypothetical protein
MKDEKETKKAWQKPKLQVLTRGRPEEAVLVGCKAIGTGPNSGNTACLIPDCMAWCEAYTGS